MSFGPGRVCDGYGLLGELEIRSRVFEDGDLASILAVEARATPGARP